MAETPNQDPASAADEISAQRSRVGEWSGLIALGISALALAIGAYQTRLMQTQARASVWPYIVLGLSYADHGERSGVELHVENNGVGPALIRSVRASLDGKPVRHWKDVFPLLMKHGEFDAVLSNLKGVVIPPSTNRETAVAAIKITEADAAKAFYEAKDRFTMDICYCSIYGDCWMAHWLKSQVDQAVACHESDDEFDY